jgi:deoxyadenosine/deoxycytidine kinase
MIPEKPIIGVVGPCASGKSTLVAALRLKNYHARHIAQEHSYVRDMWKQMSNPDFLIYLDVSFDISILRTGTSWNRGIFEKQVARLEHARNHADLFIQTDELNPQQVLDIVLDSL